MADQVQLEYGIEFEAYMDALPERMEIALEIVGGTIESYAKELCPVRTGNLHDSIYHRPPNGGDSLVSGEWDEQTPSMLIGTNVYYAPYVELGHHQQPGRFVPKLKKRLKASWVAGKPYLRPALEDHLEEYREIFKRVLDPNAQLGEG